MPGSLRLLIVNRHFWPDVSTYGQMLRQIAGRWAGDGHQVDVFAAHPSYRPETGARTPSREIDHGVSIRRIRLFPFRKVGVVGRLANSIPFFLGLIWFFIGRRIGGVRYDFVLVSTNPPVLEALLARILCALMGGRVIYHLQDIHPDVEVSAGIVTDTSWIARLMRSLDNWVCTGAAACVTLSEDMRRRVLNRSWGRRGPPDIRLINNFAFDLGGTVPKLSPDLARAEREFRVIFAGNIGFFQGLEQLIAAAHELADMREIQFVFVGNGVALPRLRELAGPLLDRTVRFVPFQPMPVAHALVEDADLAVIALKPGVVHLAYPSKTMTYATTGTPILAVVEPESALAHDVAGNDLGTVVAQDDVKALAEAIRQSYARRDELRAGRTRRKQTGEALFGADRALQAWSALIESLAAKD
jgi:glycosyltransferase involved in cell wall biosynthesis